MPADLRSHVRYPELLLELQASVYGLYHMTNPEAFYNREDLWTVASEVRSNNREQAAQPMEPNFVLMTLPGETGVEFVEILPFTPANRNNLIGWIAGRSDGAHYGTLVAYNFPKNKLVDGPLQVEARIDQNPQLSGQLSLWNQQGSRVVPRRAARDPGRHADCSTRSRSICRPNEVRCPSCVSSCWRCRIVWLTGRRSKRPWRGCSAAPLAGDRRRRRGSGTWRRNGAAQTAPGTPLGRRPPPISAALIRDAAHELAEYQRLTAEGKLGEAGQRLESLKQKLEQLQRERR